jgi:hypothetical protein
MAIENDWDIDQGDCETAFLQPEMDTDVWVHPPPSFFDRSPELRAASAKYGKIVMKALKSVPGIPQGPRIWNDYCTGKILKQGFVACQSESTLFIIKERHIFLLLCTWVDDIFVFSPREQRSHTKMIWK